MNADGTFSALVGKAPSLNLGEQCKILINITQHNRSLIVLQAIKDLLGFGYIHSQGSDASRLQFGSIHDINAFIERFTGVQLLGAKALDYADFYKAVNIINNKAHLTKEGLEAFRAITKGMNSTRTFFG